MDSIPPFLRATFEDASLAEVTSTLVALTPGGTILWVNAAWGEFARANGGEEILASFGPGRSYFDGISPPLRGFYESALANALLTGEPFEQRYECSSADTFRFFHLRLLPFGTNGVLLEHSLSVERPQELVECQAVDALYRDENGIVVQCSNCRRVRGVDRRSWDWVRDWVRAPAPRTSHGLCATCLLYYWGD